MEDSADLKRLEGLCARLGEELEACGAVLLGAGAGLSAAAGFDYAGPRFEAHFAGFAARYGFTDMYQAGFHPFASPGEKWAFWSRYVYLNRYAPPPSDLYSRLLSLLQRRKNRDWFVLTTNVDHCFERAGFDGERLFCTQGDFGLWQCSLPCTQAVWSNKAAVFAMLESQGWTAGADGLPVPPPGGGTCMSIPPKLVPACPRCGRPADMNLRSDSRFAEDAEWHRHQSLYQDFLRRHAGSRLLLLELGVGFNTPGIVKYPFWQLAFANPRAVYACVNKDFAAAPAELAPRAVCIRADIAWVLDRLLGKASTGPLF